MANGFADGEWYEGIQGCDTSFAVGTSEELINTDRASIVG